MTRILLSILLLALSLPAQVSLTFDQNPTIIRSYQAPIPDSGDTWVVRAYTSELACQKSLGDGQGVLAVPCWVGVVFRNGDRFITISADDIDRRPALRDFELQIAGPGPPWTEGPIAFSGTWRRDQPGTAWPNVAEDFPRCNAFGHFHPDCLIPSLSTDLAGAAYSGSFDFDLDEDDRPINVSVSFTLNELPAPDFIITADSDSVDYSGDGAGPCTVTTAVLEEHPASSGLYAVDFDGASGTVTCGDGLDQLHAGTIVAFVDHDGFGENDVGTILSKTAGGLSADRAWLFHVNNLNDRMQFSYYNNAGGSRALVSPTDSADPFSDYTCVAVSWTVSTLASLAGQHYIDGSPVTTAQVDAGGGDAADDDASHTVVVGNNLGDSFTFDGHIGFPLRVWRSELSEGQIAAACAQGRS